MSIRSIKVLHVENERLPREIVAHFLSEIDELNCHVVAVESEDEALQRFAEGGFDLVLLDYQLDAGDGLSCLQRIRKCDAIVPVIAISGYANPSVAGELLQYGADLFLGKKELSAIVLAEAVRVSLRRADAWRCKEPDSKEPMEQEYMSETFM